MRLFLIDGAALAYRSHFSFISNPLKNSRGLVTSGIFGFTNTLLRILEKEKPEYIAVVFDCKEDTFRHEAFPAYKAQREEMPDELVDQLPYIEKVTQAMNIPFLKLPGYEADDIIGTLARRAEKENVETLMVSGDKDFLQLVNDKIKLYNAKKGGEIEIIGTEGPVQKWGVPVEHVTDMLALMGDSSDNVPGVPGIGEKTASKLVQQFGTLEEIYRRIDEVQPERIRQKLIENRELAELCKRLVTIHTETPIQIDFHELKAKTFNVPELTKLFQELEFQSFLNSISKLQTSKTDLSKENYVLVDTDEKLNSLVSRLEKCSSFVFDTETTGLSLVDSKPIGISFSMQTKEAFYVPLTHPALSSEVILKKLKSIFENPKIGKGGQNTKFDRIMLQNAGIEVQGIQFDTMLESYLLNPGSRQHNLDALALQHLGIQKILTKELIGTGKNQISMLDVDLPKISHYACEDADITLRLHELFKPQIEHQALSKLYQTVELPLALVLGDIEKTGIKLNTTLLKKLSVQLNQRLEELTAAIYKEVGDTFNINSPKQLGPILYEKLRIQDTAQNKRVKKTQTGYATDQETLELYDKHPVVKLLLEYRNLSKLVSTYIDALPELVHPKTGRIHTSFNQTVAATGRLSSSDPNLQNIPIRTDLGKEIRKAFIAGEEGWTLISADYSQIELRILAHLSKDPNLIDTFQKNEDVHRRTASLIFGVPLEQVSSEVRSRAKAINFGVIYGMGPQRLARETGISMQEAKDFIESYFEKYSKIKKYLDSQVTFAKEHGYVTTLLGRKRPVEDINSTNPRLSSIAERIAINTPIQGTAADLIKVAMVNIHQKLKDAGLKCRMLLQVHDELVFEAPQSEVEPAKKIILHEMKHAIELSVPVEVGIGVGYTWADAH